MSNSKSLRFFLVHLLIVFCSYCSLAQGCGIDVPAALCTNTPLTFYSNCGSEYFDRYIWYVDDVVVRDGSVPYFSYTFTSAGTYAVKLGAWCANEEDCSRPRPVYTTVSVQVGAIPKPTFIASASSFCDQGTVTFSVENPNTSYTYVWRSEPAGFTGTGASITFSNVTTTTTFFVKATNGSCSGQEDVETVLINKTLVSPTLDASVLYHKQIINAAGSVNHYWQSNPSDSETSTPVSGNYAVTVPGDYYIRRYVPNLDCWTVATGPVHVELNYIPPVPQVVTVKKAGYTEVFFSNADRDHLFTFATYYWVKDQSQDPEIIEKYNEKATPVGSKLFTNGTYYLKGKDNDTGTWGETLAVTIELSGDENINWIYTKSYDGISEETAFAESKSYFGEDGRGLQTQTKSHQGKELVVFATGELRDQYDRVVGETLPVLMPTNDFRYNASTRLQEQAGMFTVDNSQVGTVGWYYSDGNNRETHVPKTNYPYSRNEYYNDGTNEVRRSTTVSDVLHMGSGKEIVSGTFPVYHELDDYLARRGEALPGIVQSATLKEKGVQNIVRDQNGIYIVTITDKNGNSIMTARKGGTDVGQHSLVISNSVTSTGIPASADFRQMTYFYILDDQAVALSGSNFYVEDILNDIRKEPGQTFAGPDGMWPAGFYRVILIDESSTVKINYKNYFTDVSYQFYDDAGRLVSSVSPNGLASWMSGAAYSVIDKTTYEYNFRGLVKSMTEVDAGTSRYIYRKDGKIRFSQNALQKENEINNQTTPNNHGKFSYTLYDDIGRPVESGEYIGDNQTYASQSGNLEYSAQQSYEDEEKKDWVVTRYDTPDDNFASTGLGGIYSQNFLRGAVSATENKNIVTWYSYDELGRVIWMAQKPRALQRVFVVKYTYDFLGNVLTTANLAYDLTGNLLQQFYHHYEYDADKRLSRAYTSIEENGSKRLRASYKYYLHGPLKRIELGDNLQGIDFVYNIHGWLTHINHPDPGQDPGGDSNDVFGMVLDYYESDLDGVFSTAVNGHDPLRWHKLPELSGGNKMLASHQPLIRFDPYSEVESSEFKQGLFKKYSAENPAYRKMLQTPSTH